MTYNRSIFAAICVVCVVAAIPVLVPAVSHGPRVAAALVPRADKSPLKKRFPFLGDFEKCSWVGGVSEDRSTGRVPGPSSYVIRAYVVLAPARSRELWAQYDWVEANGEAIPTPSYRLGEGFPAIGGVAWKSEALTRALPSMTQFAMGTVLLQPEDGLLYLNLVAD
jgi:hypothetical protein